MGLSYRLAWSFFRLAFAVYFRLRALHPERVPRQGACILAANHASYVDPPLVGVGVKRHVSMLARQSLFRFPVFGALLRSWGAVPVDPQGGSAAGLKGILDRLRDGRAVLIFPEGTRSADGSIAQARSGLGLTVLKSGAPVVPVRVWGSFKAYGRDKTIPRPCQVTVKYGMPLSFAALRQEAQGCSKARLKEIYDIISHQVMEAISAMEPCQDKTSFP